MSGLLLLKIVERYANIQKDMGTHSDILFASGDA